MKKEERGSLFPSPLPLDYKNVAHLILRAKPPCLSPWISHRLLVFFFFLIFNFCFLGLHPRHMEVPRPGLELELLLLAYARATATPDPSHIYDLHHSSGQRRVLHPLREARDRTHTSWFPIGFVSLVPRRELHRHPILINLFLACQFVSR